MNTNITNTSMSNTNTEYITLPLSQEVATSKALQVQFNDNVKIKLSTSSFLYEGSNFLQLFDIEEDNNIPIICPSSYVLDDYNAFYFDDKTDLSFMFTLDTTIFINLCHFLDIIEYEDDDTKEQFILYVMKHNIIHQLKDLHVFMRGEIISILNYVENKLVNIQVRTCTPLFYSLFLSEYNEEVIKNNRIDIYELSLNKNEFYRYVHKYENHLTYHIKETQEYKQFVFDLNNQLLKECQIKNNIKKIKELVENGADINLQNNINETPLHVVCRFTFDIDVINYLVENGANINLQNINGNNVLHYVFYYDRINFHFNIIKYLVENGANINLQNNYGKTILHITLEWTINFHVIQYLVEHGANINLQNIRGLQSLHVACSKINNLKVIKYLIKCSVDINLKDYNNETALHKASKINNNIKAIQYLVEHGADINIQNNNGDTALDIASQNKYITVVQYLKKLSK